MLRFDGIVRKPPSSVHPEEGPCDTTEKFLTFTWRKLCGSWNSGGAWKYAALLRRKHVAFHRDVPMTFTPWHCCNCLDNCLFWWQTATILVANWIKRIISVLVEDWLGQLKKKKQWWLAATSAHFCGPLEWVILYDHLIHLICLTFNWHFQNLLKPSGFWWHGRPDQLGL